MQLNLMRICFEMEPQKNLAGGDWIETKLIFGVQEDFEGRINKFFYEEWKEDMSLIDIRYSHVVWNEDQDGMSALIIFKRSIDNNNSKSKLKKKEDLS
tara:strand:+ start:734 stop:1027 length:294 start_codon:yes stop_codon:yes gene_type:complete